MKKKRLYLLIAVVGLLLMWSYCGTDSGVEKDGREGMKHLLDRPWVTKLPENPREPMHALVFVKRGNFGASINGSQYQHLVTAFRHQVKGNKLTLELLQANKKFSTLGHTYECKGPKKDLDLCLDLGPRVKQIRFYSSSKWKIREDGTPSFGVEDMQVADTDEETKLDTIDELQGLDYLR